MPQPLFDQLKPGGTMVVTVGESTEDQWLQVVTKGPNGEREARELLPVRFVPLRRLGE